MRFKQYDRQEFQCEHCGEVVTGRVTVDTLAGVAGGACMECGKFTEPLPVE